MQLRLKKLALCSLFTLVLVSVQSRASVWPVFLSPDQTFLFNNNDIDTRNCPAGEGKLVPKLSINIHQSLCKTYCPRSWRWVGKSDESCHDLKTGFNFQSYEVAQYRGKDGTTLYSVVTAFYGEKGSDKPFFTFRFTSPKQHWYCYDEANEIHTVTCANDI